MKDESWDWLVDNISTLDATGGVKRFPVYDFVRELVAALDDNRILIVAKSRQMMATWTICAWMLHLALTGEPGIYLLLSKGARDTGELVKRLKVMVNCLPAEYIDRVKVKASELALDNGSRILALPATEDAVRMHSPTAVFWDEMAFTPHSEEIWTAVKPAVDSGGRFVGISTPNGTDNCFYGLFTDGDNGFAKWRLHWRHHPLRDDAWEKEARKGLSDTRWRQEYEIDFNVLVDRVYDEFDPKEHILRNPFIWRPNNGRTYRGIDFGYRHPYVVWLHIAPDGDLVVFDEWEGFDATVEEMAEAIDGIDRKHGIREEDVTWTGCDPAGDAATDTGLSAVERLKRRGMKLVLRRSEIMTGVELVKSLLKDATGRVRLKFSPETKRTMHHLKHYRWDPGKDSPVKDDQHDHAMDALRYLIINLLGQPRKGWTGAKVAGGKW